MKNRLNIMDDVLSKDKLMKPGKYLAVILVFIVVILFLPWTQNIRGNGYLTTLKPDQRPQSVNAVIGGRIQKWYVREGEKVKKGDTLIYITEIKDDYFNPDLIENTEQQIKVKENSVNSYINKVKALDEQIDALIESRKLKLEQTQNYIEQALLKVSSDSLDVQANETNFEVSERQFNRTKSLYDQGLKSLTELENKRNKMQEAKAKLIEAENDLLTSRNQLINARIELTNLKADFKNKIAKAESEKQSALTALFSTEAEVTKLQNQSANYIIRSGFYYITAPKDGYITKTLKAGIGEIIKESEELLTIVPDKYEYAVSMYVSPFNMPLVREGQEVRFIFDGWPAFAFSGWPGISFGTFGGEVVGIDRYISDNGKYRILISPTEKWPEQLQIGSGATGFALISDVPIWYEIWRQLNGFPPDFYEEETNKNTKKKEK